MGLLEQEINELREMNSKLINGTITASEVNARIAIYSQTEKRARIILRAYSTGENFYKSNLNQLTNIKTLSL